MKLQLIFALIICSSINGLAQFDTADVSISIGFDYGFAHHSLPNQGQFPAEAFALSRRQSFNTLLGFGYYVKQNLLVDIEMKKFSFVFQEDRYQQNLEKGLPGNQVYDDFDSDNTNSTINTYRLNTYTLGVKRIFKKPGMTFSPFIRAGWGFSKHRNYELAVRPKTLNKFDYYHIAMRRSGNIVGQIGAQAGIDRWPNSFLRVSLDWTPAKLNYTVSKKAYDGLKSKEALRLKSNFTILSVGVVFYTAHN